MLPRAEDSARSTGLSELWPRAIPPHFPRPGEAESLPDLHTDRVMRWLAAQPAEEWEQSDDPRVAASLSGANVFAFAAAESFDLMDLLGLTLALALLFLAAGFIVWERGQRRVAIALAAGTLPFWLMLLFAL
jgi:hypothetical protein